MSIECRPSNVCSDIRCEICGQGFLLYGERRSPAELGAVRSTVQAALREQHGDREHPAAGFILELTAPGAENS
jgi:hypothetical protein